MLPDVATPIGALASLADYTRPELIVPQLRERDTAGIISELSQALQRQGCVPDVLTFYQAALNQELLTCSASECGIAFPHARMSGVKQPQLAFGRTAEPILWGANGLWRARFIFLAAVPATDAAGYLQLLASLAKLGQHSAMLASLRSAPDANAIFAVLGRMKLRQG